MQIEQITWFQELRVKSFIQWKPQEWWEGSRHAFKNDLISFQHPSEIITGVGDSQGCSSQGLYDAVCAGCGKPHELAVQGNAILWLKYLVDLAYYMYIKYLTQNLKCNQICVIETIKRQIFVCNWWQISNTLNTWLTSGIWSHVYLTFIWDGKETSTKVFVLI